MKINSIFICGFLISGFGMVSCSPDNTPPPSSSVERIPEAPILVSKTDQISLKEIMTTASKTWSLSDSLQFPERGSFTRLSVTAQCRWKDQEASFTQEARLKKEFSLFELTPKDLLLWDLKSIPTVCSFEFKALAPSGSSHGFNIKALRLTAPSHFSIELREPESLEALSENAPVFSLRDAQNLLLQTPQEQGLQTRLFCPIAELPSRYPDRVRSLEDFDFVSLSHESFKTKLLDNPLQICRVVMSHEGGGIEKISPKIKIQMGLSPFSITNRTVSSASLQEFRSSSEINQLFAKIYDHIGYEMVEFEITNKSTQEQMIGLPKGLPHESFGSYDEHRNQNGFYHYEGDCVKLNAPPLVLGSSIKPVKEEAQLVIFKIPAQSSASFSYKLISNPASSARKNGYFPYVTRLQSSIELTLFQQTSLGLIAYGKLLLNAPQEIIKGTGGMTVVKNLMRGCF